MITTELRPKLSVTVPNLDYVEKAEALIYVQQAYIALQLAIYSDNEPLRQAKMEETVKALHQAHTLLGQFPNEEHRWGGIGDRG